MVAAYIRWTVTPVPTEYPYWQPFATREAVGRLSRHAIDEALRSALVDVFGQGATSDSDYAAIFQPYGDKYPSLSVAKQIEMERITLESDRALVEAKTAPIQVQGLLVKARRRSISELEQLLSREEFADYQAKESTAARALANSGFNFTRSEFDAVYPLIAEGDANSAVRSFDPKKLEGIRAVLGEERFTEYRKAIDPTFQLLSAIVADYGAPNADVNLAYEAVTESERRADETRRLGPVLNAEGAAQTRRRVIDLRSKLNDLIGTEATDIYLRSLAAARGPLRGAAIVSSRH